MHESESEVTQLCPTLRNPMDCSLPGSSPCGIFQARVLEWGAIAFSDCLPEIAQIHDSWVGDAIQHLILCFPLLLLPSVFPSIRIFSSESVFLQKVAKVLELQLQHLVNIQG